MYKLVIPTAGVGSRSGCAINKALATVGDRPMITRIIDKFPDAAEVIVILGYQGSYVQQALEAAYHGTITFVTVDDHTIGLGHTLSAARERLSCPFVFCASDTLIDDEIKSDPNEIGNWAAYHHADDSFDASDYRTLEIDEGYVTSINPKGSRSRNVYIGLAGINDHERFWGIMSDDAARESGESYGLRALTRVCALRVESWRDAGSAVSLDRLKHERPSAYNVLEKSDEAIWFIDDRVVKFATDQEFIANRVRRLKFLDPALMPVIIDVKPNLYVYRYVRGVTLSSVIADDEILERLLDEMLRRVWVRRKVNISGACRSFYHDKTIERIGLFERRHEVVDQPERINGLETPTVVKLLDQVNWRELCDAPYVSGFHGDFHNENILVGADGSFKLLDWRQDFGGGLQDGDAYYDLAKFLHGLIVSHESIAHGRYDVHRDARGDMTIGVDQPHELARAERRFNAWLAANRFDSARVRTLTALIFLNICGLHHYPYSLFLYYLGKRTLTKEVTG